MTTDPITPNNDDNSIQVPIGGQRCCHDGCGRSAKFWIGPANSNGIDDYTEMCAKHRPDYTGIDDIVLEFDDHGYPSLRRRDLETPTEGVTP